MRDGLKAKSEIEEAGNEGLAFLARPLKKPPPAEDVCASPGKARRLKQERATRQHWG